VLRILDMENGLRVEEIIVEVAVFGDSDALFVNSELDDRTNGWQDLLGVFQTSGDA
jgi:hypothetical protein